MKNNFEDILSSGEGNQSKKRLNGKLAQMTKAIRNICEIFIEPTKDFDNEKIEEVLTEIEKYICDYERIMYSDISNYIYSLEYEVRGIFTSNLASVVNYVLDLKEESNHYNIKKTILKLNDHVNLAIYQLTKLKQDASSY